MNSAINNTRYDNIRDLPVVLLSVMQIPNYSSLTAERKERQQLVRVLEEECGVLEGIWTDPCAWRHFTRVLVPAKPKLTGNYSDGRIAHTRTRGKISREGRGKQGAGITNSLLIFCGGWTFRFVDGYLVLMASVMCRSNIGHGFAVASCAVMAYDWALTFGKEVELIWRRRWSLMTVVYIGLRYAGTPYAIKSSFTVGNRCRVSGVLNRWSMEYNSCNSCKTMYIVMSWMIVVVNFLLGVIMIARLYAMYQRSRKMLIFLIVIFLTVTIVSRVIITLANNKIVGEELILSGIHRCTYRWEGDAQRMDIVVWALYTAWEVLALCLSLWIVVKHIHDLRRTSGSGWTIGDCFAVLLKTHVVYFISLVAANCLQLGFYSPEISSSFSLISGIYEGILSFASGVPMFVLGPRLILGLREYHAKVAADSDTATAMTTIAFQERGHMSTTDSGSV
ncbi:hypothetical protein EV702DRAFT_1044072 [Suillus placidus]|uniref:DUF6533 domain-containing protein n=1 Tax=Suillus placidus TaxID=48579 RepID=A0A9P6ZYJ8_9AGAM|nr:hypothetical protein EV702DRAFT_1044072 [Suillus placidus]